LASYVFIFLKSLQVINVAERHYFSALSNSLLMAFAEVFVIYNIAVVGFDVALILEIGLGSGLGACTAMLFNDKVRKKNATQKR